MEIRGMVPYWFLFWEDRLLLQKEGDRYTLPVGDVPPIAVTFSIDVPGIGERPGRAASLDSSEMLVSDGGGKTSFSYIWMNLRASWDCLPGELYRKAGKAYQLLYWDRNSRFCPACGTPTVRETEISKRCPSCGKELYPVISAAVLVLVRKGEEILLVRARNFKGTFHSLVAGFLEAGETLEECVAREVKEETGLDVRNVTYWGNQPWPYPSGLMVGFIADYAGGEIRLQEEELCAGAFYPADRLPELPRKLSLARRMIDWWLDTLPASEARHTPSDPTYT